MTSTRELAQGRAGSGTTQTLGMGAIVSTIGNITGGAQPQQPQDRAAAYASLRARFGSQFRSTFDSSLLSIAQRGQRGEFDNPDIARRLADAQSRLVAAEQARAGASSVTPAPRSVATDAALIASSAEGIAAQREIFRMRVDQSEARLSNITASLARDFPKAAQLRSAASGEWDPATFVPRTRGEVEAFAQRMVVDATQAAARMEVLQTQLDAARFDAAQPGGDTPAARAVIARTQAALTAQQRQLDKLAGIVDRQSNGRVTSVGVGARRGVTARSRDDVPVAVLVQSLRSSGYSDAQIDRMIGSNELGVEQAVTPGGSTQLKSIATDVTQSMVAQFQRMMQRHADNMRDIDDDHRAFLRRLDDKHGDKVARSTRERAEHVAQARAQRRAEFEQSLARMRANHS